MTRLLRGLTKLVLPGAILCLWCVSAQDVGAAVLQQVQSGTAANNTNGIQTVTISSVDTSKSFLIFETRSNGNRPVNSYLRGRLASSTTIEFERVTDEGTPATINIQWYVATFGSGVTVQRGEVAQSATTVNVTITAVASLSQAFVLWSKTPAAADQTLGSDDPVLGELTSTTNLQFRVNAVAAHTISWQVVEFTSAADINVQKGTITTMTGATTSVTATLSPAVDVTKTFVLVGYRTAGTGADVGARMLRAQLTNSTTITIDRSIAGDADDITEIVWQAIELKDGSSVWTGNASFAAGVSQATASLVPRVNTTRAVAFGSVQSGGGQNMGRSPYAADDILGVGTVTAALAPTQLTLDRDNTADTADVGWFVVQFGQGSGFKVGSFTKSTGGAPATQTIAHGLGEVPKAIILWTNGKTNEAFSGGYTYGFGMTDGTTSKSVAAASQDAVAATNTGSRMANKALTIVQWDAGGVLAEADLTSWNDTNFQLTWTTNNATAYVIHFMAIGGSDVSAKVIEWTMTTAAAPVNQAVTGIGFRPNVVIHADASYNFTAALPANATRSAFGLGVMDADGDQWTLSHYARDNQAAGEGRRGQATNACIKSWDQTGLLRKEASWVSMDADGFTVQFTNTGSLNAARVISLALKGVNVKPGSFLKSTTTSTPTATFVQQAARSATATVHPQTFASSSTTGNLIVVSLNVYTSTANVVSVTDSKGNTYTLAAGPTLWNGSSMRVSTYYASNITGGGSPITITVTLNTSVFLEFYQLEYSGLTPTSPLDQVSVGVGTSAAMDSGSKTTTYTNELIYGFGMTCGSATIGPTFTARSTFNSNWVGDKSVTAIGTYNVDGTDTCGSWAVQMATFKVASVSQPITGVGFQPGAVLLTSFQDVTQASNVVHSRFGIGASDGTTEGSSAFADQNGVTPTNVDAIDKTSKVFVKVNNAASTIDAEANLTSLDADGFTLNWTTNDAVQTQILYLSLAPLAITEVRLISFAGTRYPRGVLLAWRTGYEIDNLGFHLHREVAGRRTRITRSLVAGSGLMAGAGTRVTAEQAYAYWDLDPAALAPQSVYWLEDVDFNGKSTWHGPFTPVAGGLTTPAIADSDSITDVGNGRKGRRRVFVRHGGEVERAGRTGRPAVGSEALGAQWLLAARPAIKIGVNRPGWYRVGQPDLVAAGLDPRADPRRLRLFVDGVEQAMVVTGEGDGRFDPTDAIEFYGTGVDTPYTDTRVYWIVADAEFGRRIGLQGARGVRPGAPGRFWDTVQRKDRSVYFAALQNGDVENWFGPLISGQPEDFTLTLSHVDPAAPGSAEIEVALQGVTISPGAGPDHRVGVLVNGTEVGELTFDARDRAVAQFAVPRGLLQLQAGANTVTLVARGGESDFSLFDVLRLSYWHTYRADADLLRFTAEGSDQVTIGGFASPRIRVIDITDPFAAIELRGAVRPESNGLSAVSVRVPGAGLHTLLAFTDATVASPASVQPNRQSNWREATEGADYLAIVHASFASEIEPLVSLRAGQGYSAVLVDVEDLYDEFSFGEKTPYAIRDFLTHARANWQRAPRFVVLVGDATLDPRDYAGFGNADFVPTKLVEMAHVALETASDDWFADADDDGLPELAVGRLPVRTPEQAATLVAKITGYETEAGGLWTKRVALVADGDDSTTGFQSTSANLEALLPAGYEAHALYRDLLGTETLRNTLFSLVSQGQLIVNYMGHGSTYVWGRYGDLLTTGDIAANWTIVGSRLPVVVAMNCLNGFFHGIYGEESLAEALVRRPGSGAVAVWASSSLTPTATQGLVNEALFRLIFQGAYTTLGEAVTAAKGAVTHRDLRRSWIFFGDPAMSLKDVPVAGPSLTRAPAAAYDVAAGSALSAPIPSRASGDQTSEIRPAASFSRLMDFDGDGRDDALLYAWETGEWSLALSGREHGRQVSGFWPPRLAPIAGHLNDDRLADVFLYDRETGAWWQALNAGNGRFALQPGVWTPGWQVSVADLSGDGRDDALLHDPGTGIWFACLSDGAGGFACHAGDGLPPGDLLTADFNGDSRADLFIYDADTGRWAIGVNDGAGGFSLRAGTWSPGWTVQAGALDADGQADLVLTDAASGAWVAAFTLEPGVFRFRGSQGPAGAQVIVLDVDGDGRDDLLRYDAATGAWAIIVNAASGQSSSISGFWAPGLTVAWGDFNGDRRADLFLYDPPTGRWRRLLGRWPWGFSDESGAGPVGWTVAGSHPGHLSQH